MCLLYLMFGHNDFPSMVGMFILCLMLFLLLLFLVMRVIVRCTSRKKQYGERRNNI